jgi:hypothetical protein
MSNIPPYQMNTPPDMMPKKSGVPVWVWILIGVGGTCFCCPVIAAILFPVFAQAKQAAKASVSLSNVKMATTSFAVYMADNDDTLPTLGSSFYSTRALHAYTKNPELEKVVEHFNWNSAVSGLKLDSIDNPDVVWLMDSNEPSSMMKTAVGFVDFHAKSVRRENLASVEAVRPIIKKPSK